MSRSPAHPESPDPESLESSFLKWLESRTVSSADLPTGVSLGIGDDGAVIPPSTNPQVVVTDCIAEETHFRLSELPLSQIGRKALAVNLSDLAAMGAAPRHALVVFQLPRKFVLEQVCELYLGIEQLAEEFGTAIIGGDTNVWDGGLVVAVTAMGELLGSQPWTQSGARPGDAILVTGQFGGSRLEKHHAFRPRLKEAERLAAATDRVSAATDASDSLSFNLSRLLRRSGWGALIEPDAIPVASAAAEWIRVSGSERSPLEHALTDGEDFELIVTLPSETWEESLRDSEAGKDWTRIGTVVASPEIRWTDGRPFPAAGYRH